MSSSTPSTSNRSYSALWNLTKARMLEFTRQREAIIWSYFFPLLMVMVLGSAFTVRHEPTIVVDVVSNERTPQILEKLSKNSRFVLHESGTEEAHNRLRTARTDLVMVPILSAITGYSVAEIEYQFDPLRPESASARLVVDNALQTASGRSNPLRTVDRYVQEPGSRYVDFLVPGLLGMNIMTGGLFGLGFAIVQMRVRKQLKRLVATPMKRSHFLLALMFSRLTFLIPAVIMLLGFSWLAFGFRVQGSMLAMFLFILLGAFTFSGIGLLIGCRTATIEKVSGLMNLIMLPMWLCSGVFFSSERFPVSMQPIIKALPLTPLIDGLRATALEGESLLEPSQLIRIGILLAWGVITFVLALGWFRWS